MDLAIKYSLEDIILSMDGVIVSKEEIIPCPPLDFNKMDLTIKVGVLAW